MKTIRTILEDAGYRLSPLMAAFPSESNPTPAKEVSYQVRIPADEFRRLLPVSILRLSCSIVARYDGRWLTVAARKADKPL